MTTSNEEIEAILAKAEAGIAKKTQEYMDAQAKEALSTKKKKKSIKRKPKSR